MFKVIVVKMDGKKIEFTSCNSYRTVDGVLYWEDVHIASDGKRVDVYSIPSRNIDSVEETDLDL